MALVMTSFAFTDDVMRARSMLHCDAKEGRARSVTPFLYQNISVVTRLLHWGLFSTAIMDSTVTFFEG